MARILHLKQEFSLLYTHYSFIYLFLEFGVAILWNGVGGLVGVYHPIQSPYNVRQYDDKF
jgi:hypothetical protein